MLLVVLNGYDGKNECDFGLTINLWIMLNGTVLSMSINNVKCDDSKMNKIIWKNFTPQISTTQRVALAENLCVFVSPFHHMSASIATQNHALG